MSVKNILLASSGGFTAQPGEVTFTTSSSWVVPEGVTEISAVCIGGGGGGLGSGSGGGGGAGGDLRWGNNIPVVPLETLTITVGTGGLGSLTNPSASGAGGFSRIARGAQVLLEAAGGGPNTLTGTGGVRNGTSSTIGGSIGGGNGGDAPDGTTGMSPGGGGAGGYSGNGGSSSLTVAVMSGGSGGGASAGGTGGSTYQGGSGGGVSVYGEGPSGPTGATTSTNGDDGFGGSYGAGSLQESLCNKRTGHRFGGGGGGDDSSTSGGNGAQGAVRIIWGTNRAFPSTNVASTLVSLVAEAQSSIATIAVPAAAQVGDLAVVLNMHETSGAAFFAGSGWNTLYRYNTTQPCIQVYFKILQAADLGATLTFAQAGSSEILIFRKAGGVFTSASISGANVNYSTTVCADITVPTSSFTGPAIAIGTFAVTAVPDGPEFFELHGGNENSGGLEPSMFYNAPNGDGTRQSFLRWKFYDSAPKSNLIFRQLADVGNHTMGGGIILYT